MCKTGSYERRSLLFTVRVAVTDALRPRSRRMLRSTRERDRRESPWNESDQRCVWDAQTPRLSPKLRWATRTKTAAAAPSARRRASDGSENVAFLYVMPRTSHGEDRQDERAPLWEILAQVSL